MAVARMPSFGSSAVYGFGFAQNGKIHHSAGWVGEQQTICQVRLLESMTRVLSEVSFGHHLWALYQLGYN